MMAYADAVRKETDERRDSRLTAAAGGLESGLENLPEAEPDSVAVHYNSDKPAQMRVLGYPRGGEISRRAEGIPDGGSVIQRKVDLTLGSFVTMFDYDALNELQKIEKYMGVYNISSEAAELIDLSNDPEEKREINTISIRIQNGLTRLKTLFRDKPGAEPSESQKAEILGARTSAYNSIQEDIGKLQAKSTALWNARTDRNPYEAEPTDVKPFIKDMHSIAPTGTVSPLVSAARPIKRLPFSRVNRVLPQSLCNLLRSIYLEWKQRHVFDKRTRTEQTSRSITSDTPGSLRSYHMNVQGTLPTTHTTPRVGVSSAEARKTHLRSITETSVRDRPGGHPGFHDHYKDTSQEGAGAGIHEIAEASYPIGYAEYTGIGFGAVDAAPHYCKIVLNYMSGEVYLTLTHYKYYKIEGGTVEIGDKTYSEAYTQNPWFCIDLNS